jgi:hypothetical protein
MLSLIEPPPGGPPSGTATGYRAAVIRALPLLVLVVVAVAVGGAVLRWVRERVRRAPPPRSTRGPGAYRFDRRSGQLKRRLKGISGPEERRDDIEAFLDGHDGVEAYVEPKTVMSPRSVVLVDAAGEWRRFELHEDAFLRRLAAERGVPMYDAAITGYPSRMRRGRAGEDAG